MTERFVAIICLFIRVEPVAGRADHLLVLSGDEKTVRRAIREIEMSAGIKWPVNDP